MVVWQSVAVSVIGSFESKAQNKFISPRSEYAGDCRSITRSMLLSVPTGVLRSIGYRDVVSDRVHAGQTRNNTLKGPSV